MDATPSWPPQTRTSAADSPHWAARTLLRAARVGTLATQSEGQPFAGLVTPATGADLSPLVLLSELSEHTRHLRRDPRCALMVAGTEGSEPNPQTIPRITLTAVAVVDDSADLRDRYLAVHPYAALYAGFGDFHLWRLTPDQGFFVGGFARARTLRWADIVPEVQAVASLAQAAPDIMAHCNADHADAMRLIAGMPGAWRMVGVDTDGCDLARAAGENEPEPLVRRVAWPGPATDADDVRRALILLARQARGAPGPSPGPSPSPS
jgi:putative heme iron utilization protein